MFKHKANIPTKPKELDMQSAIMGDNAPFSVIEAYRAVRTNIKYMPLPGVDKGKTFAITSAIAQEGKSINAYNISLVMAQSGQKVLLIDADMRNPLITRYFTVTSGVKKDELNGLSEYLAELSSDVVYKCGKMNNFHILPAGRIIHNPSELLSSKRTRQLFSLLKPRYDYIFIDTPPLNVVADALVISEFVDRYIMVVRSIQSDVNEVKRAVSALESVNGQMAGFLLNDLNETQGAYRGSYKRYNSYNRYDRYNRPASEAK